MLNWLIENYDLLLSPITGAFVWYFTKRNFEKRELKQIDINNEANQAEIVSKNLEIYQRMIDDIEQRYEERIQKLDDQIQKLEQEILKLKNLSH